MENLFDVVKPSLFSVLHCKDCKANYDLLNKIYDFFSNGERKQSVYKDELISILTSYIKSRNFDCFDNEEGEELINSPAREKASYKIRQFTKTGWLEEDNTNGFSTVLSLSDNAIVLLEVFRTMISKRSRPLEYTGYFYVIYGTLQEFNYTESKARIEQIVKNTRELFSSLQGLNSSIKHYIDDMVNNSNLTPEEIFEILLVKYQDQIILSVFNNLKGKDNPSKYTSTILERLKDIRYNNMEKVVSNYIESLHLNKLTSEKYEQLENEIIDQLNEVILRFETVDDFVRIIDNRNGKFHSTSLAKLKFLLNSRRDIDGLLAQSLRALKNCGKNNDFDRIFSIFSSSNIDDKSTYSRAFNKEKISLKPSNIPNVSNEEVDLEIEIIFKENDYSKEKVNEYVKERLKDKNIVNSQDIEINTYSDIIMLLMIQLYAEYSDMIYTIDFEDKKYESYGYLLKSFEIKKKGGIVHEQQN